ncbi:hypothetical protein ACN3VN_10195 [Xylella fastidiosa]|uniref:hypothetical protein n=1 Tax=Xylella fastidiosa TaxID=2371 RepID=UPI000B292480|nr:hypothetical protein [Xylella fastidiosa]
MRIRPLLVMSIRQAITVWEHGCAVAPPEVATVTSLASNVLSAHPVTGQSLGSNTLHRRSIGRQQCPPRHGFIHPIERTFAKDTATSYAR